uniref:Odorant binding protein 38 n=3 Tax=Neoptera TaxID=33340 RepID=A0A4Y5RDE2_NEZVI|nr:odorant binding protein 38 [Nezara viridula]QFO46786.1 odorant binding protein [Cylas formicarius]
MWKNSAISLLVLLSATPLVLSLSEEMQELANQLHSACVEETGAQESDIPKARDGVFSEDENFKCYIKCLLEQMAVIDDDGMIDVEAMISVLPEELEEIAAPVMRKCGTVKGANACENAWLTHKCYYKENPEAYFLI